MSARMLPKPRLMFDHQRPCSPHIWSSSQPGECRSVLGISEHVLKTHTAGSQSAGRKARASLGMPVDVNIGDGQGQLFDIQRPHSVNIWTVSKCERSSCSSSPVLLPSERGILLTFAPTELTEESGFSPASSNFLLQKEREPPRSYSAPGILESYSYTKYSGLMFGLQHPCTTHVWPASQPVKRPKPMKEIFSLLLQGFLLLLFLYGFLTVFSNIRFWMLMQSMLSRHSENVDNFVKDVDNVKESVKDAVDDMDNLVLKYEAYENLIMLRGDLRWANYYKPEEDFARKSAGASVINSSQSYTPGAEVCRRGFCWDSPRSPDVILEEFVC